MAVEVFYFTWSSMVDIDILKKNCKVYGFLQRKHKL